MYFIRGMGDFKRYFKMSLLPHFQKLHVLNASCVNLITVCVGKFVLKDVPIKHINSSFCN